MQTFIFYKHCDKYCIIIFMNYNITFIIGCILSYKLVLLVDAFTNVTYTL